MAKRKATAVTDETARQALQDAAPANESATSAVSQETAAGTPASPATQETQATEAQTHAPIEAPPTGKGRVWTRDNRLGYVTEDSSDGSKRQIRFADREGGQRPDDETLAIVREKKPAIAWNPKEKAWQAREGAEGMRALTHADQQLAELGRKRTGDPAR